MVSSRLTVTSKDISDLSSSFYSRAMILTVIKAFIYITVSQFKVIKRDLVRAVKKKRQDSD